MRLLKWLLIVVVVIVALGAGAGLLLKTSGVTEELRKRFDPALRAVDVRMGVVERGEVVRMINAPGELEPKVSVEISAQVSARIVELPFAENQEVREGDVVVRLDSDDLEALLESARAQLRAEEARLTGAQAALGNAETELARRRQLGASGDIPREEVDAAQLRYDSALSTLRQVQAGIEAARANIERAEKDVSNTVIRSPINGVITKLNAEVGELVVVGTLNSPGSVILEIADLSRMLVNTRVDESNISRVQVGQDATVFIGAYSDLRVPGKVEHIGLTRLVDSNGVRYFETHVAIERPENLLLRSGLTANVDIHVERFENILRVPTQAVQDRAIDDLPAEVRAAANPDAGARFQRVVFVVDEAPDRVTARMVPVTIGASDQTHTSITAGLAEGDRVVVGPFKNLTALTQGQLVKVETAVPTPGADAKPSATATAEPPPAPGGDATNVNRRF